MGGGTEHSAFGDPIEFIGLFEPEAQSARAARRFVRSCLADWDTATVAVVVLLTNELVSNVIVHAGPHPPGGQVVVDLNRDADRVRVEVADHHPGFPTLGDGALDATSGRGLLLLDALADAWGVTPACPGKIVWFEVKL